MANYHMETDVISRGQGRSITKAVNYITGERLIDKYHGGTHSKRRRDVLHREIIQPPVAPLEFYDLQTLCDEIDRAEKRYDARTAREFKGSLPNELPIHELIEIVHEYVEINFTNNNLAAIVAIHEGKNKDDPSRNNVHFHILVPTRFVEPDGFSKGKDRERNNIRYIKEWRESWAEIQNRAYRRYNLKISVSADSYEVQGIFDREPTIHLNRIDWEKEKAGEQTRSGDRKRAIRSRNEERELRLEREYDNEFER